MTFNATTETLCSQLGLVGQSQWNLLLIITGVLISYSLTASQRQQLLCALQGKTVATQDNRILRIFSNILIFSALVFFYRLSQQAAQTPTDSPQKSASNQVNAVAGGLVLAAGGLRLWDVVCLQ